MNWGAPDQPTVRNILIAVAIGTILEFIAFLVNSFALVSYIVFAFSLQWISLGCSIGLLVMAFQAISVDGSGAHRLKFYLGGMPTCAVLTISYIIWTGVAVSLGNISKFPGYAAGFSICCIVMALSAILKIGSVHHVRLYYYASVARQPLMGDHTTTYTSTVSQGYSQPGVYQTAPAYGQPQSQPPYGQQPPAYSAYPQSNV